MSFKMCIWSETEKYFHEILKRELLRNMFYDDCVITYDLYFLVCKLWERFTNGQMYVWKFGLLSKVETCVKVNSL